MDFGVQLMTHGIMTRDRDGDAYIAKIPADRMRPVETSVLAEQLGYHSVWLSDHIATERVTEGAPHVANRTGKRAYPDRPNMLDVPTTLGAIASRTTTLRFAPSVWIAPYRHPLITAHMYATLDVLSNGRVILAYGAGWERGEFEALGQRLEDRGPQTDEAIEIVLKAWTKDWIDHSGRFYDIHDVSMDPKPVQTPHPPLWYGGVTKVGARRAGRTCECFYPVYLDVNVDPALWDHLRDEFVQEAEKHGRDTSGLFMGAFATARLTNGKEPHRWGHRPGLTGTPEQVLEDLQRFADHGYKHVTFHFDVPSVDPSEWEEQLHRWSEEVFPVAKTFVPKPIG
jgi:probable F420-dependent oxidoreductase